MAHRLVVGAALCLLSLLVPFASQAQTVTFLDEQGAPATVLLDGSTVRVRVTDPTAYSSPWRDVQVATVTASLSGDTATVSLLETGPDTFVFEGDLELEAGGPSSGEGLATATAGTARDTLQVSYAAGSATATAGLVGSRISFLDDWGRESTSFVARHTVGLRVRDELRNNPMSRDSFTVTVASQSTAYTMDVTVRETGMNTGVFEGIFGTRRASWEDPSGALVVAVPDVISAELPAADGVTSSTAQAQVDKRAVVLRDAEGEPTDSFLVGAPVHILVIDPNAYSGQAYVLVTAAQSGDEETLYLASVGIAHEGQIPTQATFAPATPGDGILQIYPVDAPPATPETVSVTYHGGEEGPGTTAGATFVHHRIAFVDAEGRPASSYVIGSEAHVHLESQDGNTPALDVVQVRLRRQGVYGEQPLDLIETRRDSGVFTGSMPLAQLGALADTRIEAVYSYSPGFPVATADIVDRSLTFLDERGEPTETVVESGPARVRLHSVSANTNPSYSDTADVEMRGWLSNDLESLTLTETGLNTNVFEGSILLQMSSYGSPDGKLQTVNTGPPDYRADEVMARSGPADARARTIGARIEFVDASGRKISGLAVGEPVRLRIIDHFWPLYNSPITVTLVGLARNDAETLTMQQTAPNSHIYEGTLPTVLYGQVTAGADGKLAVDPVDEIEVRHVTGFSPIEITARTAVRTNSIRFVDAAGQPATSYLESTRAYVQVVSASDNSNPSTEQSVTVQISAEISPDVETLTLTETGPNTGVFAGSIQMQNTPGSYSSGNGILETREAMTYGLHEFDTVRATFHAGFWDEAVARIGLTGSRTWFGNAAGTEVLAYAVGATAHVWVEDQNRNLPGQWDTVFAEVSRVSGGDQESLELQETARDSGIFHGMIELVRTSSSGDGKLQTSPGEQIEASHQDAYGSTASTAVADIEGSSLEILDEDGEPTSTLLEKGMVRVRVLDVYANSNAGAAETVSVTLRTKYGLDYESLSLTETGPDTGVFEGEMPMRINMGSTWNGLLETWESGFPFHFQDEVEVEYGPHTVTARVAGARILFIDAQGRPTASYTVGEAVRLRAIAYGRNSPQYQDNFNLTVTSRDGGDSELVNLQETGFDTGTFEGAVPTVFGGSASTNNGQLSAYPEDRVETRYQHTSGEAEIVAAATMKGSSIAFIDAAGQPATFYLESSRAYVRVVSAYDFNRSPSAPDTLPVQLLAELSQDSEVLTLTETGPQTNIFEGSIPLRQVAGTWIGGNGILETIEDGHPQYDPPHELDTLRATYSDPTGTSVARAGLTGSRTWFADAAGQEVLSYPVGGTAYVRVEDQNRNQPGEWDTVYVEVRADGSNDQETLQLLETTRDSGVFAIALELVGGPAQNGDGKLQVMPGSQIEAIHADAYGATASSAVADISDLSITFIDEAGEPTTELLEKGDARVRMFSLSGNSDPYSAETRNIYLRTLRSGDEEAVTLTETGPDTAIFEGSISMQVGGGSDGDGFLSTISSGSPEYLPEEVTAHYGGPRATAFVQGARVRFVDAYGRETASYAAGESVRLRVIDHNYNQPATKDSTPITIRSLDRTDVETLYLQETGFNTAIFEGALPTALDGVSSQSDGTLHINPADEVEARYLPNYSPNEIVAQAAITGNAVLFVDAAGQPATVYLESSRAYVRVVSTSANANPSTANTVPVQLLAELSQDNEILTLTETGPNTSVFEGSIPLDLVPGTYIAGNGILETTEDGHPVNDPPHEFDTLRATYSDPAGTSVARIGLTGSRTWFGDAAGQVVESYAIGETAWVWVEDQNRNRPGVWDTVYAEVRSLGTGGPEGVEMQETTRDSGVFRIALELVSDAVTQNGNGKLQVMNGYLIRATHQDAHGATSSTAEAGTTDVSIVFLDETGEPTTELLEKGTARVRMLNSYHDNSSTVETRNIYLRTLRSGDEEAMTLTETGFATGIFEGSISMQVGGGADGDGVLSTISSGSPEYLPEEVTAEYGGPRARAYVQGARVRFVDAYGRETASYAAGESVRLRVVDHNYNQPTSKDSTPVTVRSLDRTDVETLYLQETGFNTAIFEGALPTALDGVSSPSDGTLHVNPADEVEARYLPNYSPNQIVAQAAIAGNAVLFIDAAGQPATVFLESSRAYVRVVSTSANASPSTANTLPVQLLAELSQDTEILTLTETGPNTNVFEGSIPLDLVPGTYISGNGILETTEDGHPVNDPPHEFDMLRATYSDPAGTSVARIGLTGSRTWFGDAAGQPAEPFANGSTAWVWVEDQNRNQPGVWDRVYAEVRSDGVNDVEQVELLETTRDSGIFRFALHLGATSQQNGDGKLMIMSGYPMHATHQDAWGATFSSAVATTTDLSITFLDEAGEPTTELLEKGEARVRMFTSNFNSLPDQAETRNIYLRTLRSGDEEAVTLTETGLDTGIYEGSIPMQVGGGADGDGFLSTMNSGSPEYWPEEVSAHFFGPRATALVLGARVRFVDAYGRETASYAAGESVRLRVVDHNYNQPTTRDSTPVTVRSLDRTDTETLYLQETGFNTAIFEGALPTALDGVGSPSDGALHINPTDEVEARYLPNYSPNQIVAQAAIAGNAVLFINAAGQPATVYLESSRAWVRVVSTSANASPSTANTLPVQLLAELSQDTEILTLTETGPNTNVFEGSIPLDLVPGTYISGNGILETTEDGHPVNDPPHEFDTLRATYSDPAGTSVARIGLTGSRTWFGDAAGQPAEPFANGSTAWVWVEDHNRNQPGVWDRVYVEVRSDGVNDMEQVELLETTRDSGIFRFALDLGAASQQNGDGKLMIMSGYPIHATHQDAWGATFSSAVAATTDLSITFLDEAGEPTTELLEKGEARVRMFTSNFNSLPDQAETRNIYLRTLRSGDEEAMTLTETGLDTGIYEGSIPMQVGGGADGDGFLSTMNSGSPEYWPEEVSAHFFGPRATALVLGARVRFVDAYGRETASYAAGESVRLRVIDHNYNQPTTKDSTPVTVRSLDRTDTETLYLQETGFNTAIFEGALPTDIYGVSSQSDGTLHINPTDEVEARYLPNYSPNQIVAQAAIAGNAVLFIDAAGQPATVYLESSRAYVRVVSSTINTSPSLAEQVPVQLLAELSQDTENLTLTETGPNTSVFEGSIALRLVPGTYISGNGILETTEDGHPVNDPPHEFDTLRATYSDPAGTSLARIGLTGSRIWFGDAAGQPAEPYAAGSTVYVWVEDHNRNQPGVWDTVYVELYADGNGDQEAVELRETTRDSGIFVLALDLTSNGGPQPGDGKLEIMPGYPIRATHQDAWGATFSSVVADTTGLSITFLDEAGEPTTELLEKGDARVRLLSVNDNDDPYTAESVNIYLRTSRSGDEEAVTLTETGPDTGVFEGSIRLQVGGGYPGDGFLTTLTTGAPEYLPEEVTAEYNDSQATALVQGARVRFIDAYGRETESYAAGETVGLRVVDYNNDEPFSLDSVPVTVTSRDRGDSVTLYLAETGRATFEGTLPTALSGPVSTSDSILHVLPSDEAEARYIPSYSPNAIVERAAITGNAVLFIDAAGQPATVYLESSRAYVRVVSSGDNSDPATAQSVPVQLLAELGQDTEVLTLTETGPNTSVFEGSIELRLVPGTYISGNGILETAEDGHPVNDPPHEFDMLRATYSDPAGTSVARIGLTGSRTWFGDAAGQEVLSFGAGTRAYLWIEDQNRNRRGLWDTVYAEVRSEGAGDLEPVELLETTRDSGVFRIALDLVAGGTLQNDGTLQIMPGYQIEAVHQDAWGATASSAVADTADRSILFVDEAGEPTAELLEGDVARVRMRSVFSNTNPLTAETVLITLQSRWSGDSEYLTLVETGPDTGLFEGSIALRANGNYNDGALNPRNTGAPQYLPDEVTATSGGAQATAVVLGARVRFIDAYGRETESYAAGETVGLRVVDYNKDEPFSLDSVPVTVTSSDRGDSVTLYLAETGRATFEGTLPTALSGPVSTSDGILHVNPADEVQASYVPAWSPKPIVDTAAIAGSSVLFLDAESQPATVYLESSRAYVRVTSSGANSDPSTAQTVPVQLLAELNQDSEVLTLTETGPNTSVFEGSIALRSAPGTYISGNGILETTQSGHPTNDPPHEFDTVRATYSDPSGTSVARIGMTGSRIWFADAVGEEVESYPTGGLVYVRVEDHNRNQPGVVDQVAVEVGAPFETELLQLTETGADTAVFAGSLQLQATGAAVANDGRLRIQPNDVIEATHVDAGGVTQVTASATIVDNIIQLIDAAGQPVTELLEGDVVRVRVYSALSNFSSAVETPTLFLYSTYAGDDEWLPMTETSGDSGIFEASRPMAYGPANNSNGFVETLNSGAPGYLLDQVRAQFPLYLPGTPTITVTAPVVTSRAVFLNLRGQEVSSYASGSTLRVRVTDHSRNVSPAQADTHTVEVQSLVSSDTETVLLTETGASTGIFEGTLASVGAPVADPGQLAAPPGEIEVTTVNANNPTPVRRQATILATPAPAAADDSATASENDPVTIPVLANDTGNGSLSVGAVGQPGHGSVQINPDGTVTYMPVADYSGPDTFTYVLVDGQSGEDLGTVTITVTPDNEAPTPVYDNATTPEDTSVVVSVLANDTDPDNDPLRVVAVTQPAAGGTVAINPDEATVTYTPVPNASGSVVFQYTVRDPEGLEGTSAVTVTITPVNDAPVANDDAVSTPEDTPVEINAGANDTDIDSATYYPVSVTTPANGTAELVKGGMILYTPNPNFTGTDTFSYTLQDDAGATGTATVTVTVTGTNDAPVANDDTATADEDGSVSVTVLSNDTDPENDTLDVTAVTQGTNGSVVLNANETVTYTPNANFSGTDSFTYTISDGNGGTATATVTVTITGTNDSPVANADTATVAEDGSVSITVLGNDTDPENDTLDVTAVTQGANGSVVLNANDTVTYTPNANFNGTDSFTYTISDGNGGTATATVTVTITGTNDSPVANADTATVAEDGSVSITVLGNDTDPENDTLDVTAVTQGTNGSVSLNANDTVTYTPNANFYGSDAFTYTISDGNGGTATATVTVTVTTDNDGPTANPDSASVAEDGSVTVTVLANDSDPENDTLDVTAVTQGTNGSVVLNANETVTYTPNANFNGTDSFTYTISDGNGGTATATVTVTITGTNDSPVANADTATVAEDGSVSITVLSNDTDPENDTLDVTAVTQGANGSVSLSANDTVTYTPNANFHGTDSFTYTISDGNGGTATATVTVTVTTNNDGPTANADSATVAEDGSITVSVLGNDTDPENDALDVTAVTQGANGSVSPNANETVTYAPNANFHGTDSFTYTISDGNGGTATATVTITVSSVNDEPVANADGASVSEDDSVTFAVLGNDTDADNDVLSVTAVTQGAHGSVAINPNKTLTYTPVAGYNGPDTFTYTVSDGNGGTATASVSVSVGGVNDAPIANADTATVAEDTSVSVAVLTNDSDPDNDVLGVSAVTQGAHGSVTINPNQTVAYTPVANYGGSDSFTYTASDGNGGTATATVTVTITAVNDAPVAVNDTASTIAEVAVVIPVLNNDVDIDGPSLTILSVTQPANGTVSVSGNQTLNYTPPATFRGATSFTYTVTDSAGGTATATVNVTVNAPPRVATNLQVLYELEEGSGMTVTDTSGVGTPLNLTIGSAAAVSWISGGLSVNSATLIQSAGAATKVITASQSTNAITIEAWVEPANLSQSGPAPIVSVSQQSNKRNFTLGQSGNRWDGRLRTSTTNQAGSGLTSAVGTATLNPTHVVYTRDAAGAVRIYVDGVQSASTTLSGNFSTWTGSYKLGLVNELSAGSPWLGDLFLVAIYNRALSASEVRQNWLAGE